MNNDKNSVDLEKLTSSLKLVEDANNNLNNLNLSNIILDLDTDLNKINFEHGNCLNDYRELIESLTNQIDSLKTEINELNIGLEKTIKSFSDVESDVQFRTTDLLTDVTKIPEVPTDVPTIQEKEIINTIPIGLGIAASGIAGAVGAVAVDSMMPTEKQDPLPEYEEKIEMVEKKEEPEEELDESIAREVKFDDVSPYHASRDKEVIDKFYDEEDNNSQ